MNEQAMQPGLSASTFLSLLKKGWDSFEEEELYVEPREEYTLTHTRVEVVYKQNGDVVFQLFPQSPSWPPPDRGREFLAEVIEAHFGSAEFFQASYVPELRSWAVRAVGLSNLTTYDKAFHVEGFVRLVDDTVDAL
jgi:hypothetical protein